jgi:hypothetical protein
VGGGGVRVTGFFSQTGNVSIAGSKARMLTAANFEGEVIATTTTITSTVVATDPSGKASRLQFFWAVNGRGGPHMENTAKQIQALLEYINHC